MRMFRERLDKHGGSRASTDEADRESGFYPLEDAPGDRWAARLDQIDRYLDATRPPEPEPGAAGAAPKRKRTRWWWISRGIAAFFTLFVLIVLWLAITAPLSKSLQPIAPPEITLLAADGTPIARNGADRRRAGARSPSCRRTSSTPSSPSRTGASTITGASIRAGSPAPRGAT